MDSGDLEMQVMTSSAMNMTDASGGTPLSWAVRCGNDVAARFLLEKGADPSIFNMARQTPLHLACIEGASDDIISLLLQHDAGCTTLRDSEGMTPMLLACCHGNVDAVNLLLHHGVSAISLTPEGTNGLILAARHDHADVIRALVRQSSKDSPEAHSAFMNSQDPAGWTALHWAVSIFAGAHDLVTLSHEREHMHAAVARQTCKLPRLLSPLSRPPQSPKNTNLVPPFLVVAAGRCRCG